MRILNALFFTVLLPVLLTACNEIKGEEICGVWNATGDFGQMQMEITPWEGAFFGYLKSATDADGEIITGEKNDSFMILGDLRSVGPDIYSFGQFAWGDKIDERCDVEARFVTDNQLLFRLDCLGEVSTINWYREGTPIPDESRTEEVPSIDSIPVADNTNTAASTQQESSTKAASPDVDWPALAAETFYIVGKREVVAYADEKAMARAVERLWSELYTNDFSEDLSNMEESGLVYMTYSGYDESAGTVKLTLGYQVQHLATVPTGLHGVKVPANKFWVFPLSSSDDAADTEGWDSLEELLAYRKASSVDFEVYTFDENYEITKAELWMASN